MDAENLFRTRPVCILEAHRDVSVFQVPFRLADRVGAKVKYAGSQDGVGFAFLKYIHQVIQVSGATRSNDRSAG